MRKKEVDRSKIYAGPTIIGQHGGVAWRQRAQSAHPSNRPLEVSCSYMQRTALRFEYTGTAEVPPGSPILMKAVGGGSWLHVDSKGQEGFAPEVSGRAGQDNSDMQPDCDASSPHPGSDKTQGKRFSGVSRRVPVASGWVDMSPASRSNVWAKARPSTAKPALNSMVSSDKANLSVGGHGCNKPSDDGSLPTYWKTSQLGAGLSFRKRATAERLKQPLA